MNDKCMNCTETCPQTERIQNAALGRMYAMKELVPILKKIESVELAPVVHGRWEVIEASDELYRCSACGEWQFIPEEHFAYCPYCGTKMDGDGNG